MDRFLEFSSNHPLLVFTLLASFFLVVFTEVRRKASGMLSIEASDAVKLINNDAAVIDLRSAESFARGHIVNARNIPYDELDARSDKLESWKDKAIVAVCDTGIASTRAINQLRNKGFERVYGLKGGMNGWSQAGLPVVTGKKTRSKKR